MLLWYVSSNRDEAVYEDPQRLDVTRKPDHQAFGAGGRHFCLGAALARLELEDPARRDPAPLPGHRAGRRARAGALDVRQSAEDAAGALHARARRARPPATTGRRSAGASGASRRAAGAPRPRRRSARPGPGRLLGVEDEGPRLGAAEAAVEGDQLLERAALVEVGVVEAADQDVGDVREPVGAQQVARRGRGERGERVLALDPAVGEVVRARARRARPGRARPSGRAASRRAGARAARRSASGGARRSPRA